jgi:hypothetical protein
VRSSKLSFFLNRISEVNNYLSHILFVLEQFDLDNKSLLTNKNKREKLTTEIFSKNTQSITHNVKLSFLDEQKLQSIDFLKNTVFINVNTQFEVYLKDIYLFKKENFEDGLKELNKFKVYETFIENLNLNDKISELNKSTYDYFVLRRNALVHRDKTKLHQGELADKIKADGKELNKKWLSHSNKLKTNKSKGFTINNFNFCKRDLKSFTFDELINTINFYRLFAIQIDSLIVGNLNESDVQKYLLSEFKTIYTDNKICDDYSFFLKKFNHFSNNELNTQLEEEVLLKLWKRSLVW